MMVAGADVDREPANVALGKEGASFVRKALNPG
jgi:hypothetical protein